MSLPRYEVVGADDQFVEFLLKPGESVVSEAGAMIYMAQHIEMKTGFDVSEGRGIVSKVLSIGKRMIAGEGLFLCKFTNKHEKLEQRVAFAAPYPGKIIPLHLERTGPMLFQKDAYLCSSTDVDVGMALNKKLAAGLFGGEGFVLQELRGSGIAFVHAGGVVRQMFLKRDEVLKVDSGCVVGFQPSVDFDGSYVGNLSSAFFGGEGMFIAELKGPGIIFVQSMPFSRISSAIVNAAGSDSAGEQTNILSEN